MIHASVFSIKPSKVNGQFVTSEFVNFTKYLILQELFSIKAQHENTFGEIVICLDNAKNGYWRNDFFPAYKSNRRNKPETEVNFKEVFQELNSLTLQLKENLPWKVIDVPKAEADDSILVLARHYNQFENILIHSPDKDMIQAQRGTDTVKQYSSLTKKWLVAESKQANMEEWILEHVCLGDVSDGVPKVVEHTEFSENFKVYLTNNGHEVDSPFSFKNSLIDELEKRKLLNNFQIFKTNRKGESTGEKDIFADVRFGITTLKKAIQKHGSLDNWLDSHPLYRKHYERNYVLVMEEGIPEHIKDNVLAEYNSAVAEYKNVEFEKYLTENQLTQILLELPGIFKITHELTAADFDW